VASPLALAEVEALFTLKLFARQRGRCQSGFEVGPLGACGCDARRARVDEFIRMGHHFQSERAAMLLGKMAGPAGSTATETVSRPESGIARGVWEAPSWAFWCMLAAIVLGGTAYALWRLGILRFGRTKPAGASSQRGRDA
jgi:hypothetical protein